MTNRLAYQLKQEAVLIVGGPIAWSRMGYDAKVDAIRARAWVLISGRYPGDGTTVEIADIDEAMADVYADRAL